LHFIKRIKKLKSVKNVKNILQLPLILERVAIQLLQTVNVAGMENNNEAIRE